MFNDPLINAFVSSADENKLVSIIFLAGVMTPYTSYQIEEGANLGADLKLVWKFGQKKS